MEKSLIVIRKNDAFTNSYELSLGFKVPHRDITNLLNKYKNEFEEWGVIAVELQKPGSKKGGRPMEIYYLNEPQAIYLGTMMRNSEEGRQFKKRLTNAFMKAKKQLAQLLVQKQNIEWLAKRDSGKIERRLETDTIKEFVEYAKNQGSKSADKYYMIISKMENQTLFALDFIDQKFPNLRDVLDGFALDYLKMADHGVAVALREGMSKQMPYKEIYQLARDRVEGFALSMGKTPLRLVLQENKLVKAPTVRTNIRIS